MEGVGAGVEFEDGFGGVGGGWEGGMSGGWVGGSEGCGGEEGGCGRRGSVEG